MAGFKSGIPITPCPTTRPPRFILRWSTTRTSSRAVSASRTRTPQPVRSFAALRLHPPIPTVSGDPARSSAAVVSHPVRVRRRCPLVPDSGPPGVGGALASYYVGCRERRIRSEPQRGTPYGTLHWAHRFECSLRCDCQNLSQPSHFVAVRIELRQRRQFRALGLKLLGEC